MKRSTANVLIDTVAAICLLGMIGSGYILRFPLPPGTNKRLMLWGLSRHEWGDVHFWTAILLLAVLLIHLMLHWDWIVSVARKRLMVAGAPGPKLYRNAGIIAAIVLPLVLLAFAYAARISVVEQGDPCCEDEAVQPDETRTEVEPGTNALAARPSTAGFTFTADIQPLLRACGSCHSGGQARGGFRVDKKEDYFGVSGRKPLVVPGSAPTSRLYTMLAGVSAVPLPAVHRLPDAQAELIRAWIDQGARW